MRQYSTVESGRRPRAGRGVAIHAPVASAARPSSARHIRRVALTAIGLAAAVSWSVPARAELVMSPWVFATDQPLSRTGQSVCAAGDVNGDGFSDILIGAPLYENGQLEEGRVYLFFGQADGITSSTPDWTAEVDQAFANFGTSVSTAGDLNGDGYDDIVIGAPGFVQDTDVGAAFAWYGGPDSFRDSGTAANADWVVTKPEGMMFGQTVAYVGDLDNDGFDDLAVGAPRADNARGTVFVFGGTIDGLPGTEDVLIPGPAEGSWFGTSISGGDINGDGFADMIVGAPFYTFDYFEEGRIEFYLGGPLGVVPLAADAFEGNSTGALAGMSVGFAGDMNGDGFGDVIIGAPGYDAGSGAIEDGGLVAVYAGTSSGLRPLHVLLAHVGLEAGARLGASVGTAGDLDGDGRADIVYGAPDAVGELGADDGVLYVSGMRDGDIETKETILAPDDQSDFGAACIGAGDIDGDGFSDIVTGDPTARTDAVRILYGRPRSHAELANPVHTFPGGLDFERFGASLAWADVDADGHSDLISAAPGYDIPGAPDAGRVTCRLGGPQGLASTPNTTIDGYYADSGLGASLARAGDVDGDGYDDVLIGSPSGLTPNPTIEAALFRGGPSGLGSNPSWFAGGFPRSAGFGTSVCGAGDVNGDGFADVLIGAPLASLPTSGEGAIYLYLGSATGLPTNPSWSFEGDLSFRSVGYKVAGTGDFDQDGFSDVAVLALDSSLSLVALVFNGSATGFGSVPDDVLSAGPVPGGGASLAVDGDVNGDGYSDVLVGDTGANLGGQQVGAVHAWFGGPGGFSVSPNATWYGPEPSVGFGSGVAYAGDLDFDGKSDFAIAEQSEIEVEQQGVYVVASRHPEVLTLVASDIGTQVGAGLAGTGDVNADGVPDLAIGAPGFEVGGTSRGVVWVLTPGGDYGISHRVAPILVDEPGIVLVPFLGTSDSSNRLRFLLENKTPEGRSRAFHEIEAKPLGELFDGSGVTESTEFDVVVSPIRLTQVGGLDGGEAYHWRARQRTDWPFAPRLPWQTPAGSGPSVWDVRTGGSPSSVDDAELAARVQWSIAPNPIAGRALVSWSGVGAGNVRLDLLDVTGRRLDRIYEGTIDATGTGQMDWTPESVPSGVYFLRMQTDEGVQARRIVIRR